MPGNIHEPSLQNAQPVNPDLHPDMLEELGRSAPPITTNSGRLSGAPVIGIQRLPVTTLLDYLIEGYSVDGFPEAFPGTDNEKVIAALQKIRDAFDEGMLTDMLAEKVDY